jgi:hypothetical protein
MSHARVARKQPLRNSSFRERQRIQAIYVFICVLFVPAYPSTIGPLTLLLPSERETLSLPPLSASTWRANRRTKQLLNPAALLPPKLCFWLRDAGDRIPA